MNAITNCYTFTCTCSQVAQHQWNIQCSAERSLTVMQPSGTYEQCYCWTWITGSIKNIRQLTFFLLSQWVPVFDRRHLHVVYMHLNFHCTHSQFSIWFTQTTIEYTMHQSLVKLIPIHHVGIYIIITCIVGMYMCSIAIVHYCTGTTMHYATSAIITMIRQLYVWGAHAHGGWTGA